MLDKIGLTKEDELYLLGDYIDRGPRSRGVLDLIMSLREQGYRLHCLRGNHEQMMLEAPQSSDYAQIWLRNGGQTVMNEFETNSFSEIPNKYYDFLDSLPFYFDRGDKLFVHAGFKISGDSNPFEKKNPMLWIRKWEEQPEVLSWLNGRLLLHGHTPQTQIAIEKRFDNLANFPILNIDNGCVYPHEGYQQLCCVDLTGMKLYFQKNIDV